MDDETNRLNLQTLLENNFPSWNIYYQPSGNMRLTRPCIVYEPKAFEPAYANNSAFTVGRRYQLSFLSDLPGNTESSAIFDLHGSGLMITSNRSYVNEDIVHDVFIISVNSINF